MKPSRITTEQSPNSIIKSVLYAALLTAALFLLYSAFYSNAGIIQDFDFSSIQHNDQFVTAAPTASETDQRPSSLTNVSHVLFGIAGSAATWKERSKYASIWWRPAVTRGHVWLDSKPDSNNWLNSLLWRHTTPPHKISDPIWKTFPFSSSQSAVRIARIVLESFKLGLPDVRWFVLGDDDTVFFPENLATVLGKYDHREMYYVGGNSESVEQAELHSYEMAFGGGGFAISYRLAEELVGILDSCLNTFFYFYGSDPRIWACVSELGVSLTREPGFHQLDVRGNPYGLLAAHPVAPLVSLHHLEAVEPMFPQPMSQMDSINLLMQAYKADPGRILQRSICYDKTNNWTFSVSWGYTVQLWPKVVHVHDALHAMQTFRTWRSWGEGPFVFDSRKVSPDTCEQPVVYYMDHVEKRKGESFSLYKMEDKVEGQSWGSGCERPEYLLARNVSNIAVVAAKMDLADWQKAPRRQCCEIVEGGHRKQSMKVQIRKCEAGETISNYLAV
ncbi:unnamed protein product [Rhodiola kirilowii]